MDVPSLQNTATWDREAWTVRAPAEVEFWDRWITSKGDRWPVDFQRRTDPNAPLTPMLVDLLPHLDLSPGQTIRVLDIGSGPLSYVGYAHDTYQVELTAVDPLSDEYNRLLDSVGVTGVTRTRPGYFETALADFGAGSFDVVWCFNSLDHSIDPVLGLVNLLSVVKIGGGLILSFCPNEAEQGKYKGLHQWNLDLDDDGLVLTQLGRKTSLQGLIDQQKIVKRMVGGARAGAKERVTYLIRKTANVNLSQALLK